MSGSILDDTKAALGLEASYTAFDQEIKMFINSTLSNVAQLGIGPRNGVRVKDSSITWADVTDDDDRLNQLMDYVFLSVKLLHDPPSIGFVLTVMKELREEAAWRLSKAQEDIDKADESVEVNEAVEAPITNITAGLPFARRIRVANGKNFWSELTDFEVRMQVRASKAYTSELLFDFTPWLVTTFDGNDIVIDWNLTGAQTRAVKSGYFDLVLSDVGTTDGSAIRALSGYFKVSSTTTSA